MANTPRNSTKPKSTPQGKTTRSNTTEKQSSGTGRSVNNTSKDGQENVPPPTATPRPRPQPVIARASISHSAERTPLRTPSIAANRRSGGGHVTSQPMNMDAMSAQLKELQEALNRERADRKRFESALARQTRDNAEAEPTQPDDRVRELEAELERERRLVRELRTQAPLPRRSGQDNEFHGGTSEDIQDNGALTSDTESMIPRPKGVAGKDYNIQIAMGLENSERNKKKYEAVLRDVRDLVIQSRINWELPWVDIPAAEKAKLFNVARERHPILARYTNDWATADMVRRYLKNKRSHHYKNGWLDVPEKYSHLKKNSSQRNPNASRISRAKAALAAKRRKDRRVTASNSSRAPAVSDDMDVDADVFGGGEEEREGDDEEIDDMDQ